MPPLRRLSPDLETQPVHAEANELTKPQGAGLAKSPARK
jgi:hypothetical protein